MAIESAEGSNGHDDDEQEQQRGDDAAAEGKEDGPEFGDDTGGTARQSTQVCLVDASDALARPGAVRLAGGRDGWNVAPTPIKTAGWTRAWAWSSGAA